MLVTPEKKLTSLPISQVSKFALSWLSLQHWPQTSLLFLFCSFKNSFVRATHLSIPTCYRHYLALGSETGFLFKSAQILMLSVQFLLPMTVDFFPFFSNCCSETSLTLSALSAVSLVDPQHGDLFSVYKKTWLLFGKPREIIQKKKKPDRLFDKTETSSQTSDYQTAETSEKPGR